MSHSRENEVKFLKEAAGSDGFLMPFWHSFHLQSLMKAALTSPMMTCSWMCHQRIFAVACKGRKVASGGLHVCPSLGLLRVRV